MSSSDHESPSQHRGVTAVTAVPLSGDRRPRHGPIAIVSAAEGHAAAERIFVEAVRSGGGEIAELGPHTRGLIWLSPGGVEALSRTLIRYPSIEWVQLPYAGVEPFAALLLSSSVRPLPLWTSAKGAYSQPVAERQA